MHAKETINLAIINTQLIMLGSSASALRPRIVGYRIHTILRKGLSRVLKVISADKFRVNDWNRVVVNLPVLLVYDVPLQPATIYLVELAFTQIDEIDGTVLLESIEDENWGNKLKKTSDEEETARLQDTVYAMVKMCEDDGSTQLLSEIAYTEDGDPYHAFYLAATRDENGDYVVAHAQEAMRVLDYMEENVWAVD